MTFQPFFCNRATVAAVAFGVAVYEVYGVSLGGKVFYQATADAVGSSCYYYNSVHLYLAFVVRKDTKFFFSLRWYYGSGF